MVPSPFALSGKASIFLKVLLAWPCQRTEVLEKIFGELWSNLKELSGITRHKASCRLESNTIHIQISFEEVATLN